MSMIRRLIFIVVIVLIMGVFVFVTGETVRKHHKMEDANHIPVSNSHQTVSMMIKHNEQKTKPGNIDTINTFKNDTNIRSLKEYYQRRAYIGAPPTIPHEVDPDVNRNQRCNICHEKGGYVPKFNAFTPVTPHPEFSNCTQCHVPSSDKQLFSDTDWKSIKTPEINRPALPGSPPPIPHSLQLRENCFTCHVGPAAPLEIRTTHPERENCRQCHVPRETQELFKR